MAIVETNGKSGLIDNKGRWIIPPRYASINYWGNGLAEISEGTNYFILDADGKQIAKTLLDLQSQTTTMAGKLVKFRKNSTYGGWQWGLLKPETGQISGPFSFIGEFSEGVAWVRRNDGDYGYSENGKWGLIGEDGQFIIPPKYSDILDFNFKENATWANDSKVWGSIDKKGVLNPAGHPGVSLFRNFCPGGKGQSLRLCGYCRPARH